VQTLQHGCASQTSSSPPLPHVSRRTTKYAAIGDALLARYKQAVAAHVAALPSGAPSALSEALVALGLLAQHAEAAPLLETLVAWRLGALREAAAGSSESARRRTAAVESAFWSSVCSLAPASPAPPGCAPPVHVSEALEALAFEALLAGPEAEAAELLARALGGLAQLPGRLAALTQRFGEALEARVRVDTPAAREQARRSRSHPAPLTPSQVVALCRGLALLPLDPAFLRLASPPRWAPVRAKAAFQAPLCRLLTQLLGRQPPEPQWAEALRAVRDEVLAWLLKSERKNAVGLPLAAALLCAEMEAQPAAAAAAAEALAALVAGAPAGPAPPPRSRPARQAR